MVHSCHSHPGLGPCARPKISPRCSPFESPGELSELPVPVLFAQTIEPVCPVCKAGIRIFKNPWLTAVCQTVGKLPRGHCPKNLV